MNIHCILTDEVLINVVGGKRAHPTCEEGKFWVNEYQMCLKPSSCPAGQTWSTTHQTCECPSGTTWSTADRKCL